MVSTVYLGSGRPADVVLSPDGALVYTAGTDGHVRVYSAETGKLIHEWDVGTRLGGIDLSADGQTLYAVERQPLDQYISPAFHEYWKNYAIATFYEVSTATGEASSHPFRFTMNDDGFFDLAVQPDGKVLLSPSLLDDVMSHSYLKLWLPETRRYIDREWMNSDAVLSPNLTGSKVLVGEKQSNTDSIFVYSNKWLIAEHQFAGESGHSNRGVQAYSGDGKLAARHTAPAGLEVYDAELDLLRDLSAQYGGRFKGGTTSGLAFDAAGRNLYVLDNAANAIVQISTSTWKIVQSIPVGVDFGLDPATAAEGDYGNRLLVGPNARYFTVVTDSRLRLVVNPLASDTITGTGAADSLKGTGLVDSLIGLDGNDALYGGSGNDVLKGGAGNDILSGGPGFDRLEGGAGNDTYRADLLDTIVEAAAGGADLVEAGVDFTLPDFLENLTLVGGAARGTGNAAANILTGHAGANRLDGRGGADVMRGGDGDDIYVVDLWSPDAAVARDSVIEAAGGGSDTVETSLSYVLPAFVEKLVLTGSAARDGTGNGLANSLTGNVAANVLNGADDNDSLRGGAGTDRLLGGNGADALFGGTGNDVMRGDWAGGTASADGFHFDTAPSSTANRDRIEDFQPGTDRILLAASIFTKAGAAGALAPDAFRTIGAEAADAEDRILHDRATGALFYDPDGNGAAAAAQFASVTPGLALTSADFTIYSAPAAPDPGPGEPPDLAVLTGNLGSTRPVDVQLSPDGSRVYAAGTDGNVRVYAAETGKLLATWDVGNRLGGMDVTPDGRFLWVVERKPISQTVDDWNWTANKFKVTVYRVDTATGEAASYPVILTGSEDGFTDIAALADGKVLLTTSILEGWSGHANLRLLDPATRKYAVLEGRPTADAILTPTESAARVLVGQLDTSGGLLHIYGDGGYVATHAFASEFHSGSQAYHEQAKLIAQQTFTGGIYIFDDQFRVKLNITDLYDGSFTYGETAGLAFDPSGQYLYILDTVTDSIIQVAVADGRVIRFIPVGVDFEETGPRAVDPLYGDRLLVGPNARYFTVVTNNGLRIVDNPFAADAIVGTGAADTLRGTGLADILKGLDGDDLLIGGLGADRVEGGAGNDTYRPDASDILVETAGAGVDLVEAAFSFTLPDFLDDLTLLGSAAAGTGNALANVITGNAAANRLDGRGGADTMRGGTGNDVYVVDLSPADPTQARDLVVETAAGGADSVEASVSYVLPDFVEHLTITGSAARDGTGNALGNNLTGNNAVNILSGREGNDALRGAGGGDSLRGGAGDDWIFGGTGKDSLRGDTGVDRFYFDTSPNADNRDRIEDFQPGSDLIYLAASVFAQAGAAGALAPGAFRTIGAGAVDAGDRILYDPAAGALYYDRDGSGASAAILFATVTPGLAVTAGDFIVY